MIQQHSPKLGERPRTTDPKLRAPTADLDSRYEGWLNGLPYYVNGPKQTPPAIIAVGGGKGGVGKSLVSANLAVCLGLAGKKVLAVDLDVGGSNLHTYFGLSNPKVNLSDALVFGRCEFKDTMLDTGVESVKIIAGGREEVWGGPDSIDQNTKCQFFEEIFQVREKHGFDTVIFDLGAGSHAHTIDFFLAAHFGLVTVLPEPTSIENAYSFMKMTLFRLLSHAGQRMGAAETAEEIKAILVANEKSGQRGGYLSKLHQAGETYPGFISQLSKVLAGRTLGITLNQVRSQRDIDIGKSMEMIGQQYFGFRTKFSGYLNHDDAAWKSLRNRRLLVADFPGSILARRFADLARVVSGQIGN